MCNIHRVQGLGFGRRYMIRFGNTNSNEPKTFFLKRSSKCLGAGLIYKDYRMRIIPWPCFVRQV